MPLLQGCNCKFCQNCKNLLQGQLFCDASEGCKACNEPNWRLLLGTDVALCTTCCGYNENVNPICTPNPAPNPGNGKGKGKGKGPFRPWE